MTPWLSIVTCWILALGIDMVPPPPLRSVMSVEPAWRFCTTTFMTLTLTTWAFTVHLQWPFFFFFVSGNDNSDGHRGREWPPPPDRPWETSVWERRGGHVPADHALLSWRSSEHQTVARQLRRTSCLVRVKEQKIHVDDKPDGIQVNFEFESLLWAQ